MSKIAKALAKAKKQRKNSSPEGQTSNVRDSVDSLRLNLHKLSYSQTKSIRLNDMHLEFNRLNTFLDHALSVDRYNMLCAKILQETRKNGGNTLMVTSCVEGEGKTVTAINLATSIARKDQHTVLLVDADLRNPKVRSYLGFHAEKGLYHYLEENVPLSQLLVNPGLPKMTILPAGKPLLRSTEILGSPKMERLVREMKTRYPERYVIFDCPPLLSISDSLIFSSYVDGIILVIEAGKTREEQIRHTVELLKDRPLLGLVLNKGRGSFKGYYY
jgi:exopolysaccharide/PEP-CTERM locus tyrosine autokinase